MARVLFVLWFLVFMASPSTAEPIDASQVQVLDGNTIRIGADRYSLVGFDVPKSYRPKCPQERALSERAATRLSSLIAVGRLDLRRVPCICPGNLNMPNCSPGLQCGTLRVNGRNVGEILIEEGLAKKYQCGPTVCPKRPSWCD